MCRPLWPIGVANRTARRGIEQAFLRSILLPACELVREFGDGAVSQDTSPVHLYDTAGAYQVCLTVSNPYGSDTFCQTLFPGVTSADNPMLQNFSVEVYPNPFRERLAVSMNTALKDAVFRLYSTTGQLVATKPVMDRYFEMEATALPGGFYIWELAVKNQRIKSGKCVKLD
ncbi:MAG: PKD domain-containing protein [Saprospiraceae bacterium]